MELQKYQMSQVRMLQLKNGMPIKKKTRVVNMAEGSRFLGVEYL